MLVVTPWTAMPTAGAPNSDPAAFTILYIGMSYCQYIEIFAHISNPNL
jgi:hypothetical protein